MTWNIPGYGWRRKGKPFDLTRFVPPYHATAEASTLCITDLYIEQEQAQDLWDEFLQTTARR